MYRTVYLSPLKIAFDLCKSVTDYPNQWFLTGGRS